MNLTNCLLGLLLGFSVTANIILMKNVIPTKAKLDVFTDTLKQQTKALETYVKKSLPFEATGFKADTTEDGRIKVVFLRGITDKKDEELAEFREVIMPAWMFAQVTSEAALKLGFEALEKKEKATTRSNDEEQQPK